MLYIKLENTLDECIKKEKFLKKKFFEIKKKFGSLKIEKFENIVLVVIPNIETYILNKLSKYIKVHCIGRVCLSENLMNNRVFIDFIKNENVKIFDGKWLFKHLVKDCTEYICLAKKEKMQFQEVSFLVNSINQVVVDNIYEIAVKIRNLNVITQNENQFKKIEKRLYEENGIILNISNNFSKSLIKSDIIYNFDFSEDMINKYEFPRKCCLVNLNDEVNIIAKTFEGINVNFYEIQMPNKYLKNILLKNFLPEVLYESYIYKKTSPGNIKKELKEDKIDIKFLIGKNRKN